MVTQLNLPVIEHSLPIGAINTMSTKSRGMIRITIQSLRDDFRKNLLCLTIPAISDSIPAEAFPRSSIEIPVNVKLADPEFHLPRAVDLLIGAGTTLSLFSVGQINLTRDEHDLYLQKTRLDWVVAGGTPAQSETKNACHLSNLESQIVKFWEIEEFPVNKPKSKEEITCESFFVRTTERGTDGRYTVRLPFRETDKRIGESRTIALRRLIALERKFNTNQGLRSEYTRVIEEYLSLGHMSLMNDPVGNGYYLPHHTVVKESSNTTKVRIVFDASAKTNNGISLNDQLMVGPTIQDKLFSHLLRFRTYIYVITADIEKMYRQVRLHKDDRQYQRILWRKNEKIETFQLNTLTFGVSSAPFLAIRVIQQLANDERQTYPRAAEILSKHMYVDDLSGANTITETRAIRDELIALLNRGGFTIRQWASNDKRVIKDLESTAVHANLALNRTIAKDIRNRMECARRQNTLFHSTDQINEQMD